MAKKNEGKANVVQWLYLLLEQMTDRREREEAEWLVTSPGGLGAGLSGAGGVPLPAVTRNVYISTCASGATLAAVVCADEAFVEVAEDRTAVVANVEADVDSVDIRIQDRNRLGRVQSQVRRGGGGEAGAEESDAEDERGGAVGLDEWGRTVQERLCRDGTAWGIWKKQLPDVCDEADKLQPLQKYLNYVIVKAARCVDCTVGGREERMAVGVVPYCAAAGRDGEAAAEEDVQSMVETKEGQIVLVQFC
ncbi:uncharacterized protein MONOS_12722 [Monocercomonoides exilis]|uniref:uncharacterized protein n=1 Tax=Monocercomonoides exilis TaxID=2049356 RepID=UPI00355A2977|nr:hypothetical protein MONOS_12722 [Monocercomonoides exilis]|eukprot:MONOS_12722.1-p1 / transcript=MONOS_12722.1 / gene=MONOS_12722 / organism=Monocercomonoides_exilis_PA203 / gene_product=unspecified product / transcript_product=unspecified product / location=Mono_scaffold00724:30407-31447(+) / protein_length=249 / sequence_SO=supercontig / SO=protein_coding / is_pseudo=false